MQPLILKGDEMSVKVIVSSEELKKTMECMALISSSMSGKKKDEDLKQQSNALHIKAVSPYKDKNYMLMFGRVGNNEQLVYRMEGKSLNHVDDAEIYVDCKKFMALSKTFTGDVGITFHDNIKILIDVAGSKYTLNGMNTELPALKVPPEGGDTLTTNFLFEAVRFCSVAISKEAQGMRGAIEINVAENGSAVCYGARPSGVLMHPESLSEEAQKRLERKFDQRYSGVENTGKTILLEEGMKYEQIGVPPEEAQFLESRKYSVTEIARIFGVPPHMIADLEHATFSNIESQDINFAKHSIMPECVNWEQELMRKLIRDDEHDQYEIEFVMDGLVRGDIESRYKAYAIGRQWGFLNANDIRAKENMNSVDGGETIYVPLNMIGSDLAAPYWEARIKAYEMQGKEVKNNAGEK